MLSYLKIIHSFQEINTYLEFNTFVLMFPTIAEKCNNIEIVQLNCLKHYTVNAIMPLWSFHPGVLQKAIGLDRHGEIDIPHLSSVSQLS